MSTLERELLSLAIKGFEDVVREGRSSPSVPGFDEWVVLTIDEVKTRPAWCNNKDLQAKALDVLYPF